MPLIIKRIKQRTRMELEYIEETIENKDFSNQSIAKHNYECCTFKNCDFANADLSECKFIETEFIDCNFSNANITRASFQDVKCTQCKMLGLQFDKCNAFSFTIHFDHCQLNHSSFYQMKLNRSSFLNSQLESVDFTEADLKKVVLRHCNLLNATFDNTNLENADLSGSTHYAIDPEMNKVKGASFSLPEVVGLLSKYNIKIKQS
ncbi:MAG: pentapeptide repeat-containing protein [Cyclobacteriaceae bacterium]